VFTDCYTNMVELLGYVSCD